MNISKYEWVALGAVVAFFILTIVTAQISTNIGNFAALSSSIQQQQAATGEVFENVSETSALQDTLQELDDQLVLTELVVNDVQAGSGKEVEEGDTVAVHYVGLLTNGERFDSSRDRGIPFTFTIGQGRVIAGWEQGILGMREGGTRILVIPPELGYGARSIGSIPANATLVFEIELLDVQ